MRVLFLVLLVGSGVVLAQRSTRAPVLRDSRQDRLHSTVGGGTAALRFLPTDGGYTECNGAIVNGVGGEVLTFSRASIAFCAKADGSLVSVASGQPRISNRIGQPAILIEAAATNSLLHSADIQNAAWIKGTGMTTPTAASISAPDGTALVAQLTNSATLNAVHYVYASYTTVSGSPTTFSTFLKYETHRWVVLRSANPDLFASIDLLNCTTGALSAGATSRAELFGSWCRASITWTPNASSAVGIPIGLNNADTAGFDNYTGTYTTARIWGAQIELGNYASSYIGTTTTAQTRVKDVATLPLPVSFSDATGCAGATSKIPYTSSATAAILSPNLATLLLHYSGAGTAVASYDATNTIGSGSITQKDTLHDSINKWSGSNTQQICVNAVCGTSGAFDGTWSATTVSIGHWNAGNQLGGYIGNVRIGATTTACEP